MRTLRDRLWFVVCVVLAAACALPTSALASPNLPPGSPNTISGTVRDVDGRPVVCLIALERVGAGQGRTYLSGLPSPIDGSYTIPLVAAGDYRILFLRMGGFVGLYGIPDYFPQVYNGLNLNYWQWMQASPTLTTGDIVTVSAGAAGPVGIDATLTPEPDGISGYVRDEGGTAIPGVAVVLYGETSDGYFGPAYTVETQSDGHYAFRGLNAPYNDLPYPPSPSMFTRFYVAFSDITSGTWSPQFYGGGSNLASATAIDLSGTARSGIDATLSPAAVAITGTVRDAVTHAPIEGATVQATAETTYGVLPFMVGCRSKADGTYELKGLVAGSKYRLFSSSEDGTKWASLGQVTYPGSVLSGRDFSLATPFGAGYSAFGAWEDETWASLVEDQWYEKGYMDATDVVLTAGDEAYAHEAAGAPGLCWAYQVTKPGSPNLGKNAPLIQVPARGDTLPAAQTIADIAFHNGTPDREVRVHVVGTWTAVPDRVLDQLRHYATAAGVKVTFDRLAPRAKTTRYELAGAVALRMRARANMSATDAIVMPGYAFIANGDDPRRVYGLAACSAVSAARGVPVLPVAKKGVPRAISRALSSLRIAPKRLLLVGDGVSVSEKVRRRLRIPAANRLTGARKGRPSNRYRVALAIANKAISKRWCSAATVASAVRPLEAIAGGAAAGDAGGVLILQQWGWYDEPGVEGVWVRAHRSSIRDFWLVGWLAYETEDQWTEVLPDASDVLYDSYTYSYGFAGLRADARSPGRVAKGPMRDYTASSYLRRQLSATARQRFRAAAATLGVR